MRLPHVGIHLGIILFLASCGSESESTHPLPTQSILVDSTAIKAHLKREQDSTLTAFFLQQYLQKLTADGSAVVRYVELYSDVMLPDLYESHSYQLLWNDSTKRTNAVSALESSTRDGLNPNDYHLSAIRDLISQKDVDYEVIAGLDILITDGIILYGTHLLNGKTDPKTQEPTLKFEERALSGTELENLRALLLQGNVLEIIDQLRPPSQYYLSMMKGLGFYELLSDSGAWKVVSIQERKLEPGNSYIDIPKIRDRMRAEQDLLESNSILRNDSLYDPNYYDVDLLRAVERFQERHGLNPDGVIGRGTVKAMNISVDEKIDLLKANLERARWIHHDLDSNYVLVNIAGFDLRLVKGDSLCWTTKIMAGKVTTATPVFKDQMEYLEINPDWTIPFSISNDEILPKLKKDPRYLDRNNMELLSMTGNSIEADSIDFNDFDNKMPYIIRQGPGISNSLGRIKFLFPNRFSVYLHDTPSKSLFARENRAFSHGCIRVQDPFQFAEYTLRDQGITRSYIDSVKNAGEKHRIILKEPLPVIITYSTAFADPDMVYFYEDVYKRDIPLLRALGL